MTTARATAYITACRTSGDPIRLAHVTSLCGLTNGALHRFILAALAELPVPPKSRGRANTSSFHDGWAALGARIYEAESDERAGRNAACCKRYRTKQALMEIGRERTAA